MDTQLLELAKDDEFNLTLLNSQGDIEIKTSAGKKIPYTLKPLHELYGPGINALSIQPDSDEYMPLFLGIEKEILTYWRTAPDLTDGQVSLALDRLAISPEAAISTEDLSAQLQLILRVLLSINDYSRKDVQRALRIINKSVARHTRDGGRHGYLNFIRSFVG